MFAATSIVLAATNACILLPRGHENERSLARRLVRRPERDIPIRLRTYSAASPDIAGRETSLTDPCACRASVGLAAHTQMRAIASLGPPRMRSAHIAQLPPIAARRQDADEFMED